SVGELARADILDATSFEFARTFEGRTVFVLVGVVALQIRIAPRRFWRHVTRGSGLGARGSLPRARGSRLGACGAPVGVRAREVFSLIDAAPARVLRDLRIRAQRTRAIDDAVCRV